MKHISIVGFGRFGRTLYRLVKDDFAVTLFNRSEIDPGAVELSPSTRITRDLSEVYENDVVFFAVPIASFDSVITCHKAYFRASHLLIDVLSVKLHAQEVLNRHLADTPVQAILTHPMFGPDSSRDGFDGLPIIMDRFRADDGAYRFWKDYFASKKLDVIELSADDHDRLAASSQGLTHFIGRMLEEYGFQPTPIDSLGAKRLQQVKEQTCNDAWQLFNDLQHFNPYTKEMRIRFGEAYDKLYNRLLPTQIDPRFVTFGIQGGRGSFNEEALLYFLKRGGIEDFRIRYLHTSECVMRALHEGSIDLGQLALHNSVGGVIDESIQAMARYKFRIAEQFSIKISHGLMIREDATLSEVDTVMTHPQVFAQCQHTLNQKYPLLKRVSGGGDLIDQAAVAQRLSEGRLPKNIATMGSIALARIHNLKIVEENLQDSSNNYTSFLQVARV